jgi:PAS domain S-box-containing protein
MNQTEYRILVADDDTRGLLFLQGLLTNEGYKLFTTEDGPSAIKLAEKESPDAILLDVMMPGMDGFEVCRRLRTHATLSQVPIILLTALDDRESRLEGLEAGADDFLTKPFDSTELLIRLRTITRLNRFRRLSEERARFESVVAFSPDGIAILDSTGKILLANHEFARFAGVAKPQETTGQDFFEWLNTADGDKVRQMIERLPDEPHGHLVEIKISPNTEQEAIPIELTGCTLPWEGGKAVQLVLRDCSEKKRLETQVMRFQRIELLGELAGGIAHDMNNVLGAVSGNLSLMQIQGNLPQESLNRIAAIQQSVQRGNGILRQLLGFTRGSDGNLQDVDINLAIKEVLDLIHSMIKYDYQTEVSIAPDLPLIQADPNQLHQIFMNLCVNARDAMPEGGTLKILANQIAILPDAAPAYSSDAHPGDYVVVQVSDSGTGMSEETRSKIFAPFFTTKPPGKGTGLGLATVLRLVRRHNGFVRVDSTLGKGSCFSIYLPVKQPE